MDADRQTLPRSTWALLLTLTLGWGCNWPLMKIALAEIPVWTFRSLCVAAGAAAIFAIARIGGQPLLPARAHWPRLIGASLLNVTAWNILIGYGLTLLPAGRSAILAYTMPLWVALLSVPLLREPLTPRRLLGLLLGMSGMLLLLSDEWASLRAAPVGAVLVVGAALSWALATVLMKRYPTALPTISFTGWQLLLGGLPMIIGASLLEAGKLAPLSWQALAALAYNMVVASVLCYWVWFKIVSRASATASALGTLSIPAVGVFSSMLVLGERPEWPEYLALLLVLAAIATVIIPARAGAAMRGDVRSSGRRSDVPHDPLGL
jgi:drug/metabolite transporter (DMT)-like permease